MLMLVALVGVSQATDIDDVTGKQLEAVMETEDFLAVYWYTKNCKTCERVLTVLERVSDEITEAGVTIVKVNDKKAAKAQAIRNFPALTFFKGGDAVQFEGDLMSSDSILDFLASPGSTDLADQIEDVTASQLEVLVHQTTYVAVFFFTGNRESSNILAGLETVDEDAGKLGVAFVKINDLELVAEYNLGKLPALVYYRHTIPILYQGDLSNSVDVLEWLIQNRHSGDGEDVIEEVDSATIQTMIGAVENIAVLFYDAKSRKVDQLLENLEMIDDDCDTRGIHFVKISEAGAGAKFGLATLPTLVFFRSNVPNIFDGELLDGPAVLQWLLTHLESDEIEEVTSPMLGKLVKDSRHLVVLFCKYVAYAIIALTHTAYLLKNYGPDKLKNFLPVDSVRGLALET